MTIEQIMMLLSDLHEGVAALERVHAGLVKALETAPEVTREPRCRREPRGRRGCRGRCGTPDCPHFEPRTDEGGVTIG